MKRRKFKKRLKKFTALAMGVMAFISCMLHAFHRPSEIYGVLFFVGIGYVMVYLRMIGGGYRER